MYIFFAIFGFNNIIKCRKNIDIQRNHAAIYFPYKKLWISGTRLEKIV